MQARELRADILVPNQFVWWTFLAFAADPASPFKQISMVSQLSEDSDVAIIDSRLVTPDNYVLRKKQLVIVLLWDGYQSYLERQAVLDHARQLAQAFEFRVVGDSRDLEQTHSMPCRPMFVQEDDIYHPDLLSPRNLERFSFARPFARKNLLYRSRMISLKVLMQLALNRQQARYRQTRFVYCGQSGIETLRNHAAEYGFNQETFPASNHSVFSETAFASEWIAAIRQRPRQWTNRRLLRALLRLIAVRQLIQKKGEEIFMNLYPDPNVNAYQAGMLFRRHTFIDFGGINGDEAIYPRSADLLFHRRKTIRFDLQSWREQMEGLNGNDHAGTDAFLRRYSNHVVSQLEDRPA